MSSEHPNINMQNLQLFKNAMLSDKNILSYYKSEIFSKNFSLINNFKIKKKN